MAHNFPCYVVALEGPDRMGKSTQAKLLKDSLRREGISAAVVKTPYDDSDEGDEGGQTHEKLYEMLRTGDAVRYPKTFQSLMGTNRRWFQSHVLPELAAQHDVVVLDRWNLSTLIYGTEAGVPTDITFSILKGLIDPDLTIVFDGQPFVASDQDDAYEADKEFQERIRSRYVAWAKECSMKLNTTVVVVNANSLEHTIQKKIVRAIQLKMSRLR